MKTERQHDPDSTALFSPSRAAPDSEVSLRTKISLIAAIMLLLILSYFTYSSILYSPQHLLASYYDSYRPPVVMKGAPPDINQEWEQAIRFYDKREFQQAADQFYMLIDNGIYPNYIVQVYSGVSYLGTGIYEHAEYAREEFHKVLSTENDFNEPARWYLALSYVRLDQYDEARRLLRKISDEPGYAHEAAAELLPKLE